MADFDIAKLCKNILLTYGPNTLVISKVVKGCGAVASVIICNIKFLYIGSLLSTTIKPATVD